MRGSLRRRLLVTILAAVGPVVTALAGVLFFTVQRSVWERFDAELLDSARTLGALTEFDPEDGYEFELGGRPPPLAPGGGATTIARAPLCQ